MSIILRLGLSTVGAHRNLRLGRFALLGTWWEPAV